MSGSTKGETTAVPPRLPSSGSTEVTDPRGIPATYGMESGLPSVLTRSPSVISVSPRAVSVSSPEARGGRPGGGRPPTEPSARASPKRTPTTTSDPPISTTSALPGAVRTTRPTSPSELTTVWSTLTPSSSPTSIVTVWPPTGVVPEENPTTRVGSSSWPPQPAAACSSSVSCSPVRISASSSLTRASSSSRSRVTSVSRSSVQPVRADWAGAKTVAAARRNGSVIVGRAMSTSISSVVRASRPTRRTARGRPGRSCNHRSRTSGRHHWGVRTVSGPAG